MPREQCFTRAKADSTSPMRREANMWRGGPHRTRPRGRFFPPPLVTQPGPAEKGSLTKLAGFVERAPEHASMPAGSRIGRTDRSSSAVLGDSNRSLRRLRHPRAGLPGPPSITCRHTQSRQPGADPEDSPNSAPVPKPQMSRFMSRLHLLNLRLRPTGSNVIPTNKDGLFRARNATNRKLLKPPKVEF
jgi:hypothetical protein